MSEKMKLKISKAQSHALNQIRGLHERAHYMVMCAHRTPDGEFLIGTEEDFDHLLRDLYDEVEFEMQPKTALRALSQLIHILDPADDF